MDDIIERAAATPWNAPKMTWKRLVDELVAALKATRVGLSNADIMLAKAADDYDKVTNGNESPYPTQAQMDAEDAQEMYRLAAYLIENHDATR